tara:strand:+ start:8950 stop:9168 length:219 start_codon:yes stop_codon:yes gene_type:complete
VKIAVGLATIILLAGCASGQGKPPPTFKNNTDDTLIYCETIGASSHKKCQRMQKGEAINRVNQFLNSPRARL